MSTFKLYNADCTDILQTLPKHSINLLLTDPPYNVSRDTNFTSMSGVSRIGMDFGAWDYQFDVTKYIKDVSDLLVENANCIIFNSWQNLHLIHDACIRHNIYIKRCLVLNKTNPAPFNRDRMFVNDVEFALWGVYNSKGNPTKWTFNRKNPFEKCVIDSTVQSSKLHPTMKDLKVITHLVDVLSNEGDVVLYPFMGSGTTGIAANIIDRDFIGIEIDPKYFEIAQRRITACNQQRNGVKSCFGF